MPDNYKLLYKEHPHTFSPPYKDLFRGVLFRNKEYYETISKMDIDFIPIEYNNIELFDISNFTVSLNGTVLIESIVHKVDSIIFGN